MSDRQALRYEAISFAAGKCAGEVEKALRLIAQANDEFGMEVDEVEADLLWAAKALRFVEGKLLDEADQWQRMAVREREMDGYKPEGEIR